MAESSTHPKMRDWQPLTYLITGGAGFIGSHLSRALLAQGHRVQVIDNLSTGRLDNVRPLFQQRNFHFAQASITDEVVLDRLASQADVIVHLAAAVGVKLIVEQPVHTIETNVMGTEAVLRAAHRYRAKVLVASTSEVYGKGVKTPFHEDDDVVLGPTCRNRWAYAASKMVDEFLSIAYHREKELPVVILRFFNTVGPRQSGRYGMVVPNFVRQALGGEPLSIHGDGTQSRCFCHVSDAVRAVIALAECPEAVGQVFNIGSTEQVTILDLAKRVLATVDGADRGRHWENGERLRFIPYDQVYSSDFEDMQRREPDISRIQKLTGWAPRYNLRDILNDVVAEHVGRDPTG